MTRAFILLVGGVLLIASAAVGEDVGTVAAVRGTASVGRGDVRTAAAVGMPVQLGDQLSTGADGQLRVLFRDDSVVDLSENSSLVVDQQVFDPAGGTFTSLLKLVGGKARSLVSEYYRNPGAAYQIETPTAVAGVRGTSFLVAYDPDADATEVIGIHGQIEVRSLAARAAETVYVTEQETTTVSRGQAPTAPVLMNEQLFRREVEGLELISLGNLGGLAATSPLKAGANVPAPDRAPSVSGQAGQLGRDNLRNAGDVAGQPLPIADATRGSLGVPF